MKYKMIARNLYVLLQFFVGLFFLIIAYPAALISRFLYRYKDIDKDKPRLVWGVTPIINYSIWSKAMSEYGFSSKTFTLDYYSTINNRSDWDRIISEEYGHFPRFIKFYFAFLESLFKYDVFIISFDGYFLGYTPLSCFEAPLLKLANKKIVILPYGSDSYVYRYIRSVPTLHGLMMSYPMASRNQKKISKNVDYWCRWADAVIPAFMGPDGFGRWDVLIPNTLSVDLRLFPCRIRKLWGDFKGEEIVIAHAPNHRGFKGTEFIIESINQLRGEGFNINLLLLEKMKNSEVREILLNKADILIDQVVCSGHGLNAVEGMAAGLPTISNLENDDYVLPMKRWSYFGECPLVSASPENLVEVLRKLIERPDLRKEIGIAGRAYVEKYHGLDSSQYLFCNVIDYVYGKNESIINLYHPLLGKYPNRSPKIKHPLVNNRIID